MSKIIVFILISIFSNINFYFLSMSESMPEDLILPVEIKLYILKINIKAIMDENDIFEAFEELSKFLKTTFILDSVCRSLKNDLILFTKGYAKNRFAHDIVNNDDKDLNILNLKFKSVLEDQPPESKIDMAEHYIKCEKEAAKLIIAGVDFKNVMIKYNCSYMFLLTFIVRSMRFINLINLMVAYGLDIDQKDITGHTALMDVFCYDTYVHKEHIIELLLSKGADINFQNDVRGWNILMWLIINTESINKKTLKKLLSCGLNINAQDNYGSTALHWAAQYNQVDTVRLLLDYNADENDIFGLSAREIALAKGYTNIVKLIDKKSSKKNKRKKRKNCLLS